MSAESNAASDGAADGRACLGHLLGHLADRLPLVATPQANRALGRLGLKFVFFRDGVVVAVANRHRALRRVFVGSEWGGFVMYPGCGTVNGWVPALRQIKGARRHTGLRFDGVFARCTLIPMEVILQRRGGQ